jgi:hypothetical protein
MKWGAIGVGAAVLALAAGAFVFALTTRAGGPGTPTIVTTNTPAVVTTVSTPTKPARSVIKPSCRSDSDPTGSDTPSCGSADDQAGDTNSGDSSGDDQAGDSNSGDSSGDNQAGDGKAGGA